MNPTMRPWRGIGGGGAGRAEEEERKEKGNSPLNRA